MMSERGWLVRNLSTISHGKLPEIADPTLGRRCQARSLGLGRLRIGTTSSDFFIGSDGMLGVLSTRQVPPNVHGQGISGRAGPTAPRGRQSSRRSKGWGTRAPRARWGSARGGAFWVKFGVSAACTRE